MSTSSHSADVTQADFDAKVVNSSRTIPVLVDFWAGWCAPCKMLMPVLARLADEYQGQFFLAKVDTDKEKDLAVRFGIRSLPTVKLFRNGEAVEEFLGVQPERVIREMIDRHVPRPSDALINEALRALEQGQTPKATEILTHAIEVDPANDRAKLQLAQLLLDGGLVQDGEHLLDRLSPDAKTGPDALALRARLEFARIAAAGPAAAELERMVAADPANSEAAYRLSAHKVLQSDYESALALLLQIVQRDRRFGDDAGRKTMLNVFNLMGGTGDLVKKYRKQLSMALN
ncbi:MAG: thioredoxin [Acidiferrobacterales bacterium]